MGRINIYFAVNYILKPISRGNLYPVFDEILKRIRTEENDSGIIVKSSEGIQRILISNLVFAEVIRRNVLYHHRSGKVVRSAESFCVDIRNYYQTEPVFLEGLPVAREYGHGIGTKSIALIVEKHGGVYRFSLVNGMFVFQATI